jgi:hypothetical protein
MKLCTRQIVAWLAVLVVLALGACAAPYQKSSLGGGYSEKELEPGWWRVRYWAGWADRETVQTYWLERAAELTIEQGYQGFEVLQTMRLSDAPDEPQRLPVKIAAGAVFIPIIVPEGPPPPEIEGDIHLLHQPFTPQPLRVFDAQKLLEALAPYVKGPKCKGNVVCPHHHRYLYEP